MNVKLRRLLKYVKSRLPQRKYDNHKYWLREGKNYFRNFQSMSEAEIHHYKTQQESLIQFLSNLDFNSVCEVGCGFGRITKDVVNAFMISKDNYLASDLSPHQIETARKLIGNKVEFLVSPIENIKQLGNTN